MIIARFMYAMSDNNMCEKTEPDLSLKTPAKINIYLEVLGQRKNGYHDIRSLVVPVSLFDVVSLKNTESEIKTIVENAGDMIHEIAYRAGSDENLATEAAVLLKKEINYHGGVRIYIKKNIPVGGGLGGGSADAAAVLIGLNKLWDARLSLDDLMIIGSRLGADIPALVHGGPVCVTGLGEKVVAAEWEITAKQPEWRVVIINPGFRVSTRDIYSRYISSLTSGKIPFNTIVSSLKNGDIDMVARGLFNDLQETVFKKYPLIAIIAEELKKAGSIGALLCGSGASVFGIVRDEESANRIAENATKALGCPVLSKAARILPDGVTVAHGPLEA